MIIAAVIVVGTIFGCGIPEMSKIACIGDSITRGKGAAPYPTLLSQKLSKEGLKSDVRNFGKSGVTSREYLKSREYKSALQFQPNVVIAMFGTNNAKWAEWEAYNNSGKAYISSMKQLIEGFSNATSFFILTPIPAYEPRSMFRLPVILYCFKSLLWEVKRVLLEKGVSIQLIDTRPAFVGVTGNPPMSSPPLDCIDNGSVISPPSLPSIKNVLFRDGVHPNSRGMHILAELLATSICPTRTLNASYFNPVPPFTNKTVSRIAISDIEKKVSRKYKSKNKKKIIDYPPT